MTRAQRRRRGADNADSNCKSGPKRNPGRSGVCVIVFKCPLRALSAPLPIPRALCIAQTRSHKNFAKRNAQGAG